MDLWEPSRRSTSLAGFVACALALAALLLPRGVAPQSRGPFSEEEVVQALRADVPAQRIATLARQYGISFQLTPETEARLRGAGATTKLLEALRPLAPPPPPPIAGAVLIKSSPAGAQVFLNGKLKGTTDADGELELSRLSPAEYKIRLTLVGYEDFEKTINLLTGQRASIPVTLKKVDVRQPPVTKFRVTLEHKGSGELIIGNGVLQFHPDNGSGDSFESPLREITYGPYYQRSLFAPQGTLEGFYLRPRDGKDRDFRSKDTPAILELLQQWGSRSPSVRNASPQ
jgi:hypothetical protein